MTLKRSVLAWSVQAVLCTETITIKKTARTIKRHPTPSNLSQPQPSKSESRIIVYQEYFLRLLKAPKELRDQLVIELPTLEAFRSGEVSSLKVEYIDFDNGDLQVLDSKKLRLLTIPLDPVVAKHLDEYIHKEDLAGGVVIQPLHGAPHTGRKQGSKTRGEGLSDTQLERIWKRCCVNANVPVMSPRMGRAYFASKWHFVDHKSMYNLMAILRHDDIQSTEHYLNKLVDYADVKAEFSQGQFSPFSLSSLCQRSGNCPLAASGCRCRMFQETVEVKQE